jgi:aspartyl-tRNA(Asn)/glutamyl-tRNA(Gln) amidotransferase subunit C
MEIGEKAVRNIAELAQLTFDESHLATMQSSMGDILNLVEQMQEVDTDGVEPMSNPLDATQRLREDVVSEPDQREVFQRLAPETLEGLYLVPRVIE